MAGLTVDQLQVLITADTSDLRKGLDDVKNRLGNVSKNTSTANDSFSKLGGTMLRTAAGFAASFSAISLVGDSLSSLAGLQTARSGFEVLTGSAQKASEVMKEIGDYANTTPFEFPEIAKAARTLLGFGVDAKDVNKDIRMLGDAVAASGAEFSGVSRVFGQIFAAGKVNAEDFNQLIDNGIALGPEISKQLGIPMSKLKDEIAKGAVTSDVFKKALEEATSKGGKYFGATDKLADTLNGRISTLKDTFTGFVGKVVGVDFSTGIVKADGAFAMFSNNIKNLTVYLSGSGKTAFENIKSTIITLAPAIAGVATAMVAYTSILGVATAAQGALNSVMALNPYVAAAAAIIGLTVAFASLVGSSDLSKSASERLKIAQDNVKISTDNLKLAEQQVTDARLARQGSDIAVQRAQERLTQLINSGTASALDLKEAEYNLAVAKDTAKAAANRETEAVNAAAAAKKKDADNKQAVINANDAQAQSAQRVADGYGNISRQIDIAFDKAKKAGESTFQSSLNVGGITNPIGRRASGGSVSAGSPYFVGENRDGSLNSTSELFVPRTSGTIVNSSDLQSMLGSGAKQTTNITNNYNISGIMASDKRSFAEEMIKSYNEIMRANGKQQIGVA